MSSLKRSKSNKMIAGVCGGLAKRFGIEANMMRIIYIIASILTAAVGALLYVILWIIMPEE